MHDEFAKIRWLATRFSVSNQASDPSAEIRVGIGDDGAVVDFGSRPTVITVDTQVEGVHFRAGMISERALGTRAVIAAASDVWAMGAVPNAAVVALTLGQGISEDEFHELIEGLDEGARATGARIVGGNLSSGPGLTITTTVFGSPLGKPLLRSGARAGDRVCVTGKLGAAGLGLAALVAERSTAEYTPFVDRWRRPPTHADFVETLALVATSAIDVSDGCLQDLTHMCQDSGVGAVVRVKDLPFAPGYAHACQSLDLDPVSVALTSGEDYEILFCARPGLDIPAATVIGEITTDPGVRAVDPDGTVIEVDTPGFRHFS